MATVSLIKLPGMEKLPASDLAAGVKAAQWIGINPDWLFTIMKFEGNFDPAKKNAAGSGATGLIQFMPSTAKRLGTTTDALAKMTFKQQLEYVKKYFAPARGKLKSLEDTYLMVFYPAAIGLPLDHVVGQEGTAIYTQNAGFDHDGKGYITVSDITGTIRSVFNSAKGQRLAVAVGLGMFEALAMVGVAYGLYKYTSTK